MPSTSAEHERAASEDSRRTMALTMWSLAPAMRPTRRPVEIDASFDAKYAVCFSSSAAASIDTLRIFVSKKKKTNFFKMGAPGAPSIDEVMRRNDEYMAEERQKVLDPAAEAAALRDMFEGAGVPMPRTHF